ncbi:2,4'-dihydroxyacetophenone dioxygenase family protein [Rhodococcus sp. NPDC019627]|uniref:2,4'-dihydroxyacetophenone dioxygenase family protein n=1 Tax=unclassified Rhodococcus (in: high G+C Gram-positive bacteria) TaxID=192944 RepID=UPI0033C98084
MPESATTEFWSELKPIVNALKPDAQPEVFHQFAPEEDERFYVPLSPTMLSRPLWISPSSNRWADIVWAKEAGLVNRHYHPHEVIGYTISGKWGYLEQPWTATAGSFVYETPGEAHTLVAYEDTEPMRAFFVVKGPIIWLDEDGNSTGLFDVHDYLARCREYYDKAGIGAAYVDTLIR